MASPWQAGGNYNHYFSPSPNNQQPQYQYFPQQDQQSPLYSYSSVYQHEESHSQRQSPDLDTGHPRDNSTMYPLPDYYERQAQVWKKQFDQQFSDNMRRSEQNVYQEMEQQRQAQAQHQAAQAAQAQAAHMQQTIYGHRQDQYGQSTGTNFRHYQTHSSQNQYPAYEQQQQQQQYQYRNAPSSGVIPAASPNYGTNGYQYQQTKQHTRETSVQQTDIQPSTPKTNDHWADQMERYKEANKIHEGVLNGDSHYWAKKHAHRNKQVMEVQRRPAVEEYDEAGYLVHRPKAIDKQHWDGIDLGGHGFFKLSPSLLTNYKFLNEVYINDNKLTEIPPEIGTLRELRILDVSHNRLTELPVEIGMCINLQHLNLYDNNIKKLPHQLGSLAYLQVLGIEGNPIDNEIRQVLKEYGTREVIFRILENAPVPLPPPDRDTIDVSTSTGSYDSTISLLTYNILCPRYATPAIHPYTPSTALGWDYRREEVLRELLASDASILSLQEIDEESYSNYFCVELAKAGYRGFFAQKTRADTMTAERRREVDGCATFWRNAEYACLDRKIVDFRKIAQKRPDFRGGADVYNRLLTKDHIAIVNFFENRKTGGRFIVANAHTFAAPEYADVKTVQVAMLMQEVERLAKKYVCWPALMDDHRKVYSLAEDTPAPATSEPATPVNVLNQEDLLTFDTESSPAAPPQSSTRSTPATPNPPKVVSQTYTNYLSIPLFILGDFNSTPGSAVHDLLSTGSCPPNHSDFGPYKYGDLTSNGITQPFVLKSAYAALDETDDKLEWTNYTPGFVGVLDYIWYSEIGASTTPSLLSNKNEGSIEPLTVLAGYDKEYLSTVPAWPSWHFPSDHLALVAGFGIKSAPASRASTTAPQRGPLAGFAAVKSALPGMTNGQEKRSAPVLKQSGGKARELLMKKQQLEDGEENADRDEVDERGTLGLME